MAKEAGISVEGIVTEARGNATFTVRLANDMEVIAKVSGKMQKHYIRVSPDDRVTVEISPYDLGKGRITFRYK